jgi:hypothetical protein
MAQWSGNSTFTQAEALAVLSVIPFESNHAFFVESNSTVTSMAFDSATAQLDLTVSGDTGTFGYTKTTVAKTLMPNAQNIKAHLDGVPLDYQLIETEDSWVLTLNYSHSTHKLNVHMPLKYASESETKPWISNTYSSISGQDNKTTIPIDSFSLFLVIIIALTAIGVVGAIALHRFLPKHKA